MTLRDIVAQHGLRIRMLEQHIDHLHHRNRSWHKRWFGKKF